MLYLELNVTKVEVRFRIDGKGLAELQIEEEVGVQPAQIGI